MLRMPEFLGEKGEVTRRLLPARVPSTSRAAPRNPTAALYVSAPPPTLQHRIIPIMSSNFMY